MINETRIPTLEDRIDTLSEDTDPCDLYTVIEVIADSMDLDLEEFIQTNLYKEIISATQSNPARSENRIRRMIRLVNAILRYRNN